MMRSCRLSTLCIGSLSVSRSSRAGCRVSRAPTSAMSGFRAFQLDESNIQQWILFRVSGEHALAASVKRLRCHLLPLGLSPEPDQSIGIRFRAGVSGGKQGRGVAPVDETEVSRHPEKVT